MKTITLEDIRALEPCYNPDRHLENGETDSNWTGTIIDILNADYVPAHDRLWVSLRSDFVTQDTLNTFTDYCGGGDTPLSAATEQLKRSIIDIDLTIVDSIVFNIQNQQIMKLIEIIQQER